MTDDTTRDRLTAALEGRYAIERELGEGGMATVYLADDLFESADALAERLGMSRSELYATAVAEYLAKHRDEDVTGRLNAVFADEPSGIDPALRSAQARSVSSAEW